VAGSVADEFRRTASSYRGTEPDESGEVVVSEISEAMRQSGHYGPRVEIPDDADEQTRLIAFTGRRP
jgi:hypothetical protein